MADNCQNFINVLGAQAHFSTTRRQVFNKYFQVHLTWKNKRDVFRFFSKTNIFSVGGP